MRNRLLTQKIPEIHIKVINLKFLNFHFKKTKTRMQKAPEIPLKEQP